MSAVYIENWFALGACIYGRKTADAALAALGLRKEIKRKPMYPEIEASALAALREKGLSVRKIANIYGVSYTFVRNRLLAAGVSLERMKPKNEIIYEYQRGIDK
nr:MAG TPA: helix-turn-helix domain protein [Bacteriophage sp.]